MIENLYRETVTLRRPKPGTRAIDASTEYEIVLGDGDLPVRVRCRIERRGRRLFTTQGVELQGDATMLFRKKDNAEVLVDDIVVDRNGDAWKVMNVDAQKLLWGMATHCRADLQSTVDPVPNDLEVEG